jgi:predicted O-methyltransferase YrrM
VRILDEHVARYLTDIRPPRSEVMTEMEAIAARDGVPIVHWETGRFLAVLCAALDPVVLEVGTAIGYSTLHMAEQLRDGRVITLELREDRARQATEFFERAGVADRVELLQGDARETIETVEGPIDLLFLDATKDQYLDYLELAEPKLSEGGVLVVDNALTTGADQPGAGYRGPSQPEVRELNAELLDSDRWLACVLPVGEGIAFATRR